MVVAGLGQLGAIGAISGVEAREADDYEEESQVQTQPKKLRSPLLTVNSKNQLASLTISSAICRPLKKAASMLLP